MTVSWGDHAFRDFQEQERYYSSSEVFGPNRTTPSFASLGCSEQGSGLLGVCEPQYMTSFSWACRLTRFLDKEHFDKLRKTENRGGFLGLTHTRTDTRSVLGSVSLRYHDGVKLSRDRLPRAVS